MARLNVVTLPGRDTVPLTNYNSADLTLVKETRGLTFLGLFGLHRFYRGKWGTGLRYLFTLGLLGRGILYDSWTLNAQISERNRAKLAG